MGLRKESANQEENTQELCQMSLFRRNLNPAHSVRKQIGSFFEKPDDVGQQFPIRFHNDIMLEQLNFGMADSYGILFARSCKNP